MEAQLIVEGIGAWKSFDEIEEHLILDELLLLHDALNKSKHHYFRMMGSFAGVDIGELDDETSTGPELPPEILAAEQEFKERNKELIMDRDKSEDAGPKTIDSIFGYNKV
jgi:hypothetical protein